MSVRMQIIGAQPIGSDDHVLLLREVGGAQRFGAIAMQRAEIVRVMAAATGLRGPRPSTHEAWAATVTRAGLQLEELVIHGIGGDDTVLCLLAFRQGDRRWTQDCRPSDGIGLALRLNAPVVCEEPILRLLSSQTKQEEDERDNAHWAHYFSEHSDNLPKA